MCSLVISSMVALNAALPDIAVANVGHPDPTDLDRRRLHPGARLPAAARGCARRPVRPTRCAARRARDLRASPRSRRRSSTARCSSSSRAPSPASGAAFVMPATLSLLTAAYPKDERNKAVGIWAGVAGSGAIVGFLGTGLLLHFFEWQSIFWAFAVAGAAAVRPARAPFGRRATTTPPRSTGSAPSSSAARVAIFVFGVIEAPGRGWTHPVVWGCMAAGVALAVAFARRRTAPTASAARRPTVRPPRLRHRRGRHHVPVLRQLRLLLRRHAVHAADPRLQPARDRVGRWRRWSFRSSC